jgi:N-methylhydantoinase A/oxoprolinase/acetone carboxylase beta subunit
MQRIGIDVGASNPDTVLIAENILVHAVKALTTAEVTSGIDVEIVPLAYLPSKALSAYALK